MDRGGYRRVDVFRGEAMNLLGFGWTLWRRLRAGSRAAGKGLLTAREFHPLPEAFAFSRLLPIFAAPSDRTTLAHSRIGQTQGVFA